MRQNSLDTRLNPAQRGLVETDQLPNNNSEKQLNSHLVGGTVVCPQHFQVQPDRVLKQSVGFPDEWTTKSNRRDRD